MPRTLTTRTARRMNSKRATFGAGTGRPREKTERCPCQAMTLKRAMARGKTALGHDPSCPFYRERAIIV